MEAYYPEVTRVEVISSKGRELVKYNVKNVRTSLQDNGRTLKVFFKDDIQEIENAVEKEIVENLIADLKEISSFDDDTLQKITAKYIVKEQ